MTLQEKEKAYNRIIGSLDCGELKDAFDAMQSLIAGSREPAFSDTLQELQDTYRYMLRYRSEGIKDPMQEQIYRRVWTSAYALADSIRHRVLAAESPLAFFSMRRSLSVGWQTTFRELHLRISDCVVAGRTADYDAALAMLFNRVWVSGLLTSEESSEIRDILFDKDLPFAAGCQVVSALMLGLQETFDTEKLTLLFDAAEMENEEVRIRAVIAILLTLYVYRKRTALYPQITDRLDALAEKPGFTRMLRTITLRFILARETEKITHRLQTEFLPEMMKMNTDMRNKIMMSDIAVELTAADMNPEWERLFEDHALGKLMEEFGEMQQEGADVMHSTFVHLKSFPFFRETGNWFLPFTPQHSSFGCDDMQLPAEMETSPLFCNSDKYSLCFCLLSLPEENRRVIAEQLTSRTAGMKEQDIKDVLGREDREEAVAGMYIRDLYRFFKLYPRHLDFDDVFALPLDFHNLSILRPYFSDEESLRSIAEYYLRKNHFGDALTVFLQLAETGCKDDDVLLQKIGYCKEMGGDVKGALEAYLHADLLNPKSKWVMRRIAGCHRAMKKPEEALKYYRRCEQLSPDDLSVTIAIGHCFLEMRDYAEALKCFYKADYMDGSPKVWRPIAWCSFLIGKYDQSRGYYKKILSSKPNAQDLLNAGHTEWALQNIKGATGFYRRAVEMSDGDFHKFREEFCRDIPDLIAAGIEEGEIPLMLDQLRYSISDSL